MSLRLSIAALAAAVTVLPAIAQTVVAPPPAARAEVAMTASLNDAERQPQPTESTKNSEEQTPPAQTEPPPPPPLQAPPDQTPAPSVLSGAASAAYDRRDSLPNVNIYLPEGQASVRLRKLIRNVLFESQIDYRFVNGDISTFLRYKYYARTFTYRLGVFDQISFPDVGSKSKKEFERVRGGLLLFEFPRNYNNRYFWLIQDDRLTFGDPTDVDNRRNNIYTKIAYQYGTQFDERMNAIAGESRGRITPVLTAFRELGPQKFSLAAALTESFKVGTGDYRYTKLESEALKRTDVTGTTFLVSRVHGGAFLTRNRRCNLLPSTTGDPVCDPATPEIESFSIPRYEMFSLGGREALRAVDDTNDSEGSHEVHLTNEYFVPIFRNRDFRTKALHWNTMYGIAYLGAGSVGFDFRDLTKSERNVVDAGLGTEMALSVRDIDIILSVLYARTLHAPAAIEGGNWRFSIRTVR